MEKKIKERQQNNGKFDASKECKMDLQYFFKVSLLYTPLVCKTCLHDIKR